jgi:hypothetical protein
MKPVKVVTISLLLFIALAQLLRGCLAVEITINGGREVPVWISAVAVVIFGGLAAWLWRPH